MTSIGALSEYLDNLPAHSVLAHQDRFVEAVRTFDLESALVEELGRVRADHRYPAPMRSSRALNISAGKWHFLDLYVFDDREFVDPLTTHPSDTIYHFLGAGECVLHQLNEYDNGIFSRDSRAQLVESGKISSGTTLAIDASRLIASFRSPAPLMALSLSNRRMKAFSWDFSLSGGEPKGHYNNYALYTILEVIAKMIGNYGDVDSINALKVLLNHESDTIKWHAAFALLKISAPEGCEAFRLLSRSANPQLAQSSGMTVTQIEGVL